MLKYYLFSKRQLCTGVLKINYKKTCKFIFRIPLNHYSKTTKNINSGCSFWTEICQGLHNALQEKRTILSFNVRIAVKNNDF